MAPPAEDSSHDNSIPTANSLHASPNSKPASGLHYSNEALLSLKRAKEDSLTEKTDCSVVIEKKPSDIIEDEQPEDVRLYQSQDVGQVEPQGEDEDKNLDGVVLEKKTKKKKKKSSGKNKNKQEPPNGFEGNSLPSIICSRMLILRYRIFRRYTHHPGRA
jgi:hypothetical protein